MKETTLANIENLALKHITLQSDYVSAKNNLYETCLNEIKKHFYQDNVELFDEEKKQLDDLHKEKILISDAIYVVNKDGYIGESTKSEIEFAKEHNKEIMYLEPIN